MTAKLLALLAVVVALAGLALWGQQGHAEAAQAALRLKAMATQLESTQAALRASTEAAAKHARISNNRQVKINQLTAQAAQHQKALNAALKENRTWADAPVPDSVLNAIGATPADHPPDP